MSEVKPVETQVDKKPHKERHIGVVVSDGMDKSRVIQVQRYSKHKKYGKFLRLKNKIMAHDEKNESKKDDRVEIVECRPLSKRKFYRVSKILKKRIAE
jgi:small subunit ribosomal protein S17